MRSLGLIMLVVAAACASETVNVPPPPTMSWSSFDARPGDAGAATASLDREKSAANQLVLALGSGGEAKLARLLDENVHLSFAGAEDWHGRERSTKALGDLFGAFDDRTLVARRTFVQRGAVVVEWSLQGTHAREWRGVAPTHQAASFSGIALATLQDDGEIGDLRVTFDVGAVRAALQASPSPEPRSPGGPVVEPTGDASEARNASAVQSFLDALEIDRPEPGAEGNAAKRTLASRAADEAAYVGAVTDDVEVTSHGSVQRGREAARAYFTSMRKAIGQLDVTTLSSASFGPFVVVEYTMGGEQLGAFAGVPFTGEKVVLVDTVDVIEMRDGKIARIWRYDDADAIASKHGP